MYGAKYGANLTPDQIALVAVVALFAYVIKGFAGFGSAIVMVSVLTLFVDLKTVVFVTSACAAVNGAVLYARCRSHVTWRPILWLVAASVLGVGAGTYVLMSFSGEALKKWLGVFVCAFSLYMLFQSRRGSTAAPRPWPEWLGPVCGFVAGVVFGVYGTGGPIVVIYLVHRLSQKDVLRGSLIAAFLVIDALRLCGYIGCGLATGDAAILSCFAVPAAVVGGHVGTLVQARVDSQTFRRVVAVVLLAAGVLLTAR